MFGISFFTGPKFAKAIADYLGVDRRLYSSALLEAGTTNFHLKILKQAGYSVEEAANDLMPTFERGLAIIKNRFGEQPSVTVGEDAIKIWSERWDQDEAGSRMVSSEHSEGRYELSYPIQMEERISGKPVVSESTYVMASDDLEDLQGIGLVKSLGGVDVVIIDTLTGEAIPVHPTTPD